MVCFPPNSCPALILSEVPVSISQQHINALAGSVLASYQVTCNDRKSSWVNFNERLVANWASPVLHHLVSGVFRRPKAQQIDTPTLKQSNNKQAFLVTLLSLSQAWKSMWETD